MSQFRRAVAWTSSRSPSYAFSGAMLVLLLANSLASSQAFGQEESETSIINFEDDIQPIFEANCLECHGPDDAKNGFRIDDPEWVLAYVEPGDVEGSSLWTDYLITDDPDFLMPPGSATKQAGLSGVELATVKLWIEEGAKWDWVKSEPAPSEGAEVAVSEGVAATAPLALRIWAFQGLFHPASVHFPIALLLVSSGFVFLSFFRREAFEPVAFHCLWIGALGAVASCVMGWAYASHEGYGSAFSFDLQNSSIDRHRWLGIAVAVVSVALIPVARGVRRSGSTNGRLVWSIGALALLGAVSITGYQGGELTYGEDHYEKEFNELFPEYAATETESAGQTDVEAEGAEATGSEEIGSTDIDSADAGDQNGDSSDQGDAEVAEEVSDAEGSANELDTSDVEITDEKASNKESTEAGKTAAEEESGGSSTDGN